ncbi:hypothetical protein EJB05_46950, partial [Eragrostis curvula]
NHGLLGVPSSWHFLLLVCSFLSFSHARPCKCPGVDQDQLGNQTISDTFDQIPGYLIHMNTSKVYGVWDSLSSYVETHNPMFNLSDNGWFILSSSINLWETNYDGTDLYEASFSFIFTFSIYTPVNQTQGSSNLVFAIRPDNSIIGSLPPSGIYLKQSNPTSRYVGESRVSAEISIINETILFNRRASSILVQIRLEYVSDSSVVNNYSMRIDYDHVGHHIYAYIDGGEETPDPDNAIAERFLNISGIMWPESSLGFYSSIGQLLQLQTWTSTKKKEAYLIWMDARGSGGASVEGQGSGGRRWRAAELGEAQVVGQASSGAGGGPASSGAGGAASVRVLGGGEASGVGGRGRSDVAGGERAGEARGRRRPTAAARRACG